MTAWDKVSLLKSAGGLSPRKTKVINKAFLSKLAWKLFNGIRIWVEHMPKKNTQLMKILKRSALETRRWKLHQFWA